MMQSEAVFQLPNENGETLINESRWFGSSSEEYANSSIYASENSSSWKILQLPSDKSHKYSYGIRHEEQYLYLVPKLYDKNILGTPPETVDKLSGKHNGEVGEDIGSL